MILELYYENKDDRALAERASATLSALLAQLAPWVDLEIHVTEAQSIERHRFTDRDGIFHDVPCHAPATASLQALLITSEDIGAEGWGWPGCGVVSRERLRAKEAKGHDMANITIHEWLHTIEGHVLNGRPVPPVDDAEKMGYQPSVTPVGERVWHDWYRYCLGG